MTVKEHAINYEKKGQLHSYIIPMTQYFGVGKASVGILSSNMSSPHRWRSQDVGRSTRCYPPPWPENGQIAVVAGIRWQDRCTTRGGVLIFSYIFGFNKQILRFVLKKKKNGLRFFFFLFFPLKLVFSRIRSSELLYIPIDNINLNVLQLQEKNWKEGGGEESWSKFFVSLKVGGAYIHWLGPLAWFSVPIHLHWADRLGSYHLLFSRKEKECASSPWAIRENYKAKCE